MEAIRTSNSVCSAGTVTTPSFGTATQPLPVLYSKVPKSPASVSPRLRLSSTSTSVADGFDKDTLKLANSPSLIVPASLIVTVGRSSSGLKPDPLPSSTMVAIPVAGVLCSSVLPESVNVSGPSNIESFIESRETVKPFSPNGTDTVKIPLSSTEISSVVPSENVMRTLSLT